MTVGTGDASRNVGVFMSFKRSGDDGQRSRNGPILTFAMKETKRKTDRRKTSIHPPQHYNFTFSLRMDPLNRHRPHAPPARSLHVNFARCDYCAVQTLPCHMPQPVLLPAKVEPIF